MAATISLGPTPTKWHILAVNGNIGVTPCDHGWMGCAESVEREDERGDSLIRHLVPPREAAFRRQYSLRSFVLEVGAWLCVAVTASVTVLAIYSRSHHQPKLALTCAIDWRLCKDNLDLMKHYAGRSAAQAACVIAANKAAQHGEVKLPLQPFEMFHGGDHYVQSGFVTLIEPHATYSGEQGGMLPKTVTCEFDLARHKVTDLIIVAAD